MSHCKKQSKSKYAIQVVRQVHKQVPNEWQRDKTALIARTYYTAVSQCFYPQH